MTSRVKEFNQRLATHRIAIEPIVAQRRIFRIVNDIYRENVECEPRDCGVETALDRLPNGIVVLVAEITATT